MGRLAGKVVIVTGALGGIGRADAALFAREGARLVLTDITETGAEELLGSLGTEAMFLQHDVASEDDWARVVAGAQERFGRVDGLVNNAGLMVLGNVVQTSLAEWRRVMSVNLDGVFLGCRAVLPALERSGGGSIVNISSMYALIGSGTAASYTASKGAVRLLTRTAAVEHAKHGIRMNSIYPGVIDTAMSGEEAAEEIRDTPMKRIGRPEEVAYGALFLACDESSFVTGAELVIDGGYTAR